VLSTIEPIIPTLQVTIHDNLKSGMVYWQLSCCQWCSNSLLYPPLGIIVLFFYLLP